MSSYNIIGLMSGTSTDGLDIAYCNYTLSEEINWTYRVLATKFIPYTNEIKDRIHSASQSSAWELCLLHHELAKLWSAMINAFIAENDIQKSDVHAIASHGQTIFHRPELQITTQIGDGQVLATQTLLPVICDFRNKDVQHGGQGAPLVPIGDQLLFGSKSDAFINIGGFTNISIVGETVEAFDICPGNLPLNFLASKTGVPYDSHGKIAASGKLIPALLDKLNNIDFYHSTGPKSLGTEWLVEKIYPLLGEGEIKDELNTVVEHLAQQISKTIQEKSINQVYLTGGGTFNDYLVHRIKQLSTAEIIVPEKITIEFKEAIIFGFLAALYLENKNNCLSSVTGARADVRGGVHYSP